MTAIDWPVRPVLARPSTSLAFEVRPKVTVAASEPAALAVKPTLPVLPARMLAGEASASLPLAVAATTSRLSWKLASVVTVLVTPTLAWAPVRMLPSARVVFASVARARS